LAYRIGSRGTGLLRTATYGRTFVRIDRWYPSSKTCSACGAVVDSLPLDVRVWNCAACGITHDRDVNAARSILAAGLAVIACGDSVRPEPVKTGKGSRPRSRNRLVRCA
jgi:putative transposase